jgi:hypothetical protein
LTITERLVGKDSLDYARTLGNIGIVYESQSKYDDALKIYKESLTITERLVAKDSLYYSNALYNLSLLY